MATPPQGAPVWFITGCSTGFGRELARLVLARGWRCVATARDKARVADLTRGAEDRALALDLDVADAAQIAAAVRAAEAGPLGIKVTCVEPGPFRTDWAGRSLRQTPNRIPDYAATAGARLDATARNSGSQPGDPARAAEAMIKATEAERPPRHLVLGAFGVEAVTNKLKTTLAEVEAWRETSLAADFPKA